MPLQSTPEPLPDASGAPNPGKEGAPVVPATGEQQVALSGKQGEALTADPATAEAAGKVHTEFVERTGKVDEPTAKADMDVLTGKSPEAYTIEDIRYNTRLLKKKGEGEEKPEEQVANLKEETARRMKAYTTDAGDGWFQLDYAKMGTDKNGLTHELYVGLGDILLDLDIQNIVVQKEGGLVKAHRGIVASGSHAGRVGFLDEAGEYVATHTGDKFRIISSDKMDVTAYAGKLTEETGKREAGRAAFKSGTVDLYVAEGPVTLKEAIDLKETTKDGKGNEVTFQVDKKTIEGAAAECSGGGVDVEKAVERPNLMKVLNYIAYKVGVPPYGMLAVIKHECGVKFPAAVGDGGLAVGMGQHHPEAWATCKKQPIFQTLVGSVIKEEPNNAGRNANIFVDLVGVAVMMKMGFDVFGFEVNHLTDPAELLEKQVTSPDGVTMTKMAWLRMFYHVPSYARQYAKAIKSGSMDRVSEKAQGWLKEHGHRYVKLSETATAAKQAMAAKGVLMA
jgi:hypothetical protein